MNEYVEPVPVVRYWLPEAVQGWMRFMYGRRRGWFAWGWLLPVFLFAIAVKALVFWAGWVLLIAAAILSAVYDLASYPLRRPRQPFPGMHGSQQ